MLTTRAIDGCSKTKRKNKTYILAATIFLVILVLVVAFLYRNVSPAYPKEWVGISLHELSKDEARMVKESGACWIRIDVFPGFETEIKNATEQGLKVLAILDSWMFEQQTNFTLEEWRSNVTHYVSQYAENVDAWEIWNEPANPLYPLTAEFYGQMVEIASPIIRQYDPTAKIVLFGGLNLWSGNDPHLELDKEFAQNLTNKGIEQYGDAISIHAYPWSTKIEPTLLQKYTETIAYYLELFTLEFWLTETGYPIDFEGEEGQARYMRDSLDYFRGKVEKFFWYSLVDNDWEDMSFGLLNDDKTPRLAYDELRARAKGKCQVRANTQKKWSLHTLLCTTFIGLSFLFTGFDGWQRGQGDLNLLSFQHARRFCHLESPPRPPHHPSLHARRET